MPIAGIPYEEAWAIYQRHHDELLRLPGFKKIEFGQEGVVVYTDQPELVPPDFENSARYHPESGLDARTGSATRARLNCVDKSTGAPAAI